MYKMDYNYFDMCYVDNNTSCRPLGFLDFIVCLYVTVQNYPDYMVGTS